MKPVLDNNLIAGPVMAAATSDNLNRRFGNRYLATGALKKKPSVETLLATDHTTGGTVVLKVLSTELASAGVQMRLDHEFSVLREVDSPYLTPLMDVGHEKDYLYVVRPFVSGTTLQARLQEGPLSLADTVVVGNCLLSALNEIHGR